MSRLRRTGTGNLRPPHLGPYPDTTFQIWAPHLTCPGTSSSGTALFSSLLDARPQDRPGEGEARVQAAAGRPRRPAPRRGPRTPTRPPASRRRRARRARSCSSSRRGRRRAARRGRGRRRRAGPVSSCASRSARGDRVLVAVARPARDAPGAAVGGPRARGAGAGPTGPPGPAAVHDQQPGRAEAAPVPVAVVVDHPAVAVVEHQRARGRRHGGRHYSAPTIVSWAKPSQS